MFQKLWRCNAGAWPELRRATSFSRLRPNLHYAVSRTRTRTVSPTQRDFSLTASRPARYVRFDNHHNATPNGSSWNQYTQYWNRWDGRLKSLTVVMLFAGVYYVAHLEQVPETGRWRFMNTSPEAEARAGESARLQIRREMGDRILDDRHPLSRHVRRVVQRILSSNDLGSVKGMGSGLMRMDVFGSGDVWDPAVEGRSSSTTSIGPGKEWDVIVVNDPKVINAMAASGMVVVFTGILPVCQDEQGLSAVLSHEIGHIVTRHSAERMSSKTVAIFVLLILNIIGIDLGLSRLMQEVLLELPNSRAQEREADHIGIKMMAKACYDPGAAPQVFERLRQMESKIASKVNFEFLQTHPSSKSRVEYLQQALPEAYAIRASNAECTDEEKVQGFWDASRG